MLGNLLAADEPAPVTVCNADGTSPFLIVPITPASRRLAARQGTQFRYLKAIKSVRLRVEARVFKGSFVAFELF